LRIHLRDENGAPYAVENLTVNASNGHSSGQASANAGADLLVVVVGSDDPLTISMSWRTGSDPMHDTINHRLRLSDRVVVHCDEIVDVDVDCAAVDGGSCSLGMIIGNI